MNQLPDSLGAGAQVGPYKLLDVLGEGGMGEVWLAEQSEPVRRRVAVKVIKLGMDTKQVLARLEAERQALAVMDHPNIARFFDGGATGTGRPYFVMELVRGISLTDYCDTHRLTTDERIRLFIDVCHAVQHAHHKGVIHWDLKPSNVLVTVKDKKPVVKIIDFGIAKALGQELTDRTPVTRMDQIIGTPDYMSPEQAELSGLDVDTRTDVYSLGVMLYELLVGARPFDLGAKADQAVRYAIRETEVQRPSTRLTGLKDVTDTIADLRQTSVEALKKEFRSELDWIILKAMEKDRTLRYDTANGLAEELERHLRNEPVLAHAPSPGYRLKKFIQRHRLEAAKAQAVNDFMSVTLLSPDPVDGLGADATLMDALDAAVNNVGNRFSSEPEVDAEIRSSIGWAYFKLTRYDDAEPLIREALRIREGMSGGESLGLATSLCQVGALLEVRNQPDSAEAMYHRALDMSRRLLPGNHRQIAET